MEANAVKSLRLAQQIDAILTDTTGPLDADSSDSAEAGPEPETAHFTLYEMIGTPGVPGERGSSKPAGQWITTVTVKAEWQPFDDE